MYAGKYGKQKLWSCRKRVISRESVRKKDFVFKYVYVKQKKKKSIYVS